MNSYITKIKEVLPHPNADRLEIAIIKNWQSIVPKGLYKPGDVVMFVEPDSTIDVNREWAKDYTKYLGSNGRVRIVRLRGELSNGLIVSTSDIHKDFIDWFSKKIVSTPQVAMMADTLQDWGVIVNTLDADAQENFSKFLGIGHYEKPVPQDLNVKTRGLPPLVPKSDETNWQSLSDEELHIGEEMLITRKVDGSSGTIYFNPTTDEVSICSRSLTMKIECNNNYTVAMRPWVDFAKWVGHYFNEPVAIRGEVIGNHINANKWNQDAKKPLQFLWYGVLFPEQEDELLRNARWGTERHMTKIKELAEENGITPPPMVPILGTHIITKEWLKEMENAPASNGEGIVVNGKTCTYKVRSGEYDGKTND